MAREMNVGNLVANLSMDTSGFAKGLQSAADGLTNLKKNVEIAKASLISLMTNPAVLAMAAVSAMVALGKAAFDASEEVNSALDTIRVGTGATGDALKEFEANMANVAKRTGAAWEDVGTIMADVSTRMDLGAGQILEDVTTQFLEIERMTGASATAMSEYAAKAFQNWGLAQEEYTGAVDVLWKVSQATGATIEGLSNSLAQNGAVLRTFGFSMVEAASLVGTLEKQGIEASQVMQGFKRVTDALINNGWTDLRSGIDSVFESIKNAASETDALSIASEYFGERAGVALADAIRSGKLELDEFTAAVLASDETVMKASEETTGFAERFNQLARRVEYALTPLGTNIEQTLDVVFKGLNWIAENILPGLAQAYSDFVNFTQGTVGKLVTPFLNFFGKVADTFKKFWKGNENETTSAVSVIMGRISELTDSIGKALDWILTTIWPAVELWIEQLVNLISLASSLIAGDWEGAWKAVLSIAETAGRALYSAMEYIWNGIAKGIENVLQGIVNGFFSAMNSAIDIVENAINGLARMWNGSWLAELTGWKAGTVSWHLETPDVPELLKFGDSALGKGWAEKLDSLIDTTEIEQTKTNNIIDTSTGKIDSTLQSGFAGLGGDITSMQNSLQSGLAGMQNSLNSISANTATSAVQNLQQAVTGETSKYYDSSGNFVNRDDYYSGEYYFANATIEYLDDGRLVMTRENGDRLVMGVMKPGDREKYDIDSVFNVGGGVGGLMGNIAVDTRLKQEYEAYLAAKAAAEAGTNKTPNSSGGSSSGGSSSKKPTISGTQQGVIVGTPSASLPTTPANKTYDSGGQTVNITVNGDVSTPSTFAQTVSKIADALSKPLISWFT